jgi:hypothetical protein
MNLQTLETASTIWLKNQDEPTNEFDRMVVETVDEVFTSFGDKCKKAVYFHLENDYKISRSQIPERIPDFASAIEQLFGVGASIIEIEIMRRLHNKTPGFKHPPKNGGLSFSNYVISLNSFIRT